MYESCAVSERRLSFVVRVLVLAGLVAFGLQGTAVAQGVSVEQVAFEGGVWAERWNESSQQYDLHNFTAGRVSVRGSKFALVRLSRTR